jgi:hypothetical protein
MSQLPPDCLAEIFEYLDEDIVTLRSCLLVNRLWYLNAVRILWRRIRNYNTLISLIPDESKNILLQKRIVTSILPTPTINYLSYCKFLSFIEIFYKIEKVLDNQPYSSYDNQSSSSFDVDFDDFDDFDMVIQIILKMFMDVSSLKVLDVQKYPPDYPKFTLFPRANECLKNLSGLYIDSDIYSEFFNIKSHNIETLGINFVEIVSNGLADFISAQQNLKHLVIYQWQSNKEWMSDILTSFEKLTSLIKLTIQGDDCYNHYIPLLFITKLSNLRELTILFDEQDAFEDFKILQYSTFPHLQVLKFPQEIPRKELLINFLEKNGKNLKEFHADEEGNQVNLALSKFCPNLKKLSTGFKKDELEMLKTIFSNCQYLESIKIWCGGFFLNDNELFLAILTYSPKNFHGLQLCYSFEEEKSEMRSEDLDLFFKNWAYRLPRKPFTLAISRNGAYTLDQIEENMQVIQRYIELGILNEFKVVSGHCYIGC